MTPYLLSVDPGAASGWALWRKEEVLWSVLEYGHLNDADALGIWSFLGGLLEDWRETTMIIEDQWYRPPTVRGGKTRYHSAPFISVKILIESRCAWQAAALIAGADVRPPISPGRWIRDVSSGAQGDTPEERVLWVCTQRYHHCLVTSDEAAAIMLGRWWLTKEGEKV